MTKPSVLSNLFCKLTALQLTPLHSPSSCSQVPDSHEVLLLQGGGTGQFAAIPLNLTSGKDDVVDYLVTGTWSNKAAKEAEKYVTVNYVVPKKDTFTSIPPKSEWNLSPNAVYVYYTDNETVHG